MHDFITLIKKTSLDAIEASKPVAVQFGKVTKTSPLTVNIEQKITVDSQLIRLKNQSFIVGDKVALLRLQGGQQFLILGVVV